MPRQIHFVTGKLAEHALRRVLAELAPRAEFEYTVEALGITVAALLTTDWVAPRIHVPSGTAEVMLPGYCGGDLAPVEAVASQQSPGVRVLRGPKDLRQLPEFFGQSPRAADYGAHTIEILAEINHAPRLKLQEILDQAARMKRDGADLIDVGCDPGQPWSGIGEAVRALRDLGCRVSIDSFDPGEVQAAVRAGAELVLSVNATNRRAARDWGVEVVVLPDVPGTLEGLEDTLNELVDAKIPLRIDPILEPIGFGFAASLARYHEVRRRWPDAEMLMGIGNLTELTDCDSAGLNVMLLGVCQELAIHSVLTTEVINWARTSVRECDLARRLVYHAVTHRTLPKRVEPGLVVLRDPKLLEHGVEGLADLARQVKDRNYRLVAERGELHAINALGHWRHTDPFELFELMRAADPALDVGHAFYLGYELAKAVTALTLSKNYQQDQALEWGYLTRPEESHRERKKH
jgi:dihydropteroate synthase-like protein